MLDELRFVLNCNIEHVLATHDAIDRALTRYYGLEEGKLDEILEGMAGADEVEVKTGEEEGDADGEDAPVIRLVTLIIVNAVKARASDIHVEPMADRLRIRYRVDGVCFEVDSPPKRLQGAIISRIKIMAGMDMAEKRRMQDGRIKINVVDRELDLRVSSLPATHGESVVMRILDRQSIQVGLKDLGFHGDDLKAFAAIIRKPNGIFLITGPTGSGKTTTLYAALQKINSSQKNIITIEDPIEYHLDSISQIQVSDTKGLDFASGLRALVRQDPDIMMVGEVRDEETARIATQSATEFAGDR